MLNYLARNTRPDIEYAVHQCARFQSDPRKPHGNAIKRIGRYLLGTRTKGIIFKPTKDLSKFECFVDADFAGNYSKETCEDENSVKSRTGCVIKYAGCPITYFSRLQSEIALSTTEAEYIALSTAAREVLPLRELIIELKSILNIPEAELNIQCTLFEDNRGAEELAKVPKSRPRTKHIAVKYHHFRSAVKNGILKVTRVDTKDQLADIFTKALPKPALEHLRKGIMGWPAILSRGIHDPTVHKTLEEQCFGTKHLDDQLEKKVSPKQKEFLSQSSTTKVSPKQKEFSSKSSKDINKLPSKKGSYKSSLTRECHNPSNKRRRVKLK